MHKRFGPIGGEHGRRVSVPARWSNATLHRQYPPYAPTSSTLVFAGTLSAGLAPCRAHDVMMRAANTPADGAVSTASTRRGNCHVGSLRKRVALVVPDGRKWRGSAQWRALGGHVARRLFARSGFGLLTPSPSLRQQRRERHQKVERTSALGGNTPKQNVKQLDSGSDSPHMDRAQAVGL